MDGTVKLVWEEAYSIGHEEIDSQHKKWLSLYNKLDTAMLESDSDVVRKTRGKILQEMSDYVDYHFQFEEQYMKEIDYPDAISHWRLHKNFRNEIYKIIRENEEDEILLNTEIMSMIKNWLLDHILEHDMKIKEFLLSQKDKE